MATNGCKSSRIYILKGVDSIKLSIAEKPSAAQTIAKFLGVDYYKKGYLKDL